MCQKMLLPEEAEYAILPQEIKYSFDFKFKNTLGNFFGICILIETSLIVKPMIVSFALVRLLISPLISTN